MKPFKRLLILGVIVLSFFLIIVIIQLSKNLQTENVLTDVFFKSDTVLHIEEINNVTFTQMNTSKGSQKRIKELLREWELTKTDDSYSPLDANYRIVSTVNSDDQMYLFLEERVVVFPHKSSRVYKVNKSDDLNKLVEIIRMGSHEE